MLFASMVAANLEMQSTSTMNECEERTLYGEDLYIDSDIDPEPHLTEKELDTEYKNARMAFLFGQYKLAYKLWLPLADDGYANAQATIGWMYHTGKGVKQNYNQAYYWYRKAAIQGHVIAKNNIGVFYEQGLGGLAKSYGKAAKAYRDSAELGYSYAQYNLGMLYKKGRGVKKNQNKAIYWLQIAALQGVKQAQTTLDSLNHKAPNHKKSTKDPIWNKQGKLISKHSFNKNTKNLLKNSKYVYQSSWILKQDPGHFTIQIASGNNLKQLIKLSQSFPFKKKAAYYTFTVKGQKSYGLLYGSYTKFETAKADNEKLPDHLRKGKPWVRKFNDIQSEIRANLKK